MAPTGSPTRPTLMSVAARAGVSRQTVSNVLHAPDVVQQGTRARVEQAIAELGYRPNLAARQMRTSRSQAIAVRIRPSSDGINAVVLDRFVHALCAAAERHAYHLVVFTAHDDTDEIRAYEHLDHTLTIDGYVVVGTHAGDRRVDWLLAGGRPFVTFGRPWGPRAPGPPAANSTTSRSSNPSTELRTDHTWIDVDGAAGTYAATRHLLENHPQVAFLGWTDSVGTGDDREAGWRRALADAGHDAEPIVLRGSDTLADGGVMATELADRHPEVGAAVCVSDSIAIGALRSGHPLALVGFDDTATAQALGLTSVAQPYEEAATRCFAELHRRLVGGDQSPTTQLLLAPELRIR